MKLLKLSKALDYLGRKAVAPLSERCTNLFINRDVPAGATAASGRRTQWFGRVAMIVLIGAALYGIVRAGMIMTDLTMADLALIGWGAGATFLRVSASLVI